VTSERPGAAGALALAAASGLAAVLAFPPFGAWPLAYVAAALLWLALGRQRPRFGFALGFVSAFVLQTLFGWWLFPAGVRAEAYFAGAALCAAYAGVFGAGACWLEARAPAFAPLALPSLWGLLEWLRASLGWLAAPWCVLGYTQGTERSVAGVAALAGVWGLSFVVMSGGLFLAALAPGGRRAAPRGAAGVLLALALLALLGGGAFEARRAAEPTAHTLRVAVLQGGRHVPGRESLAHAREVFERYRGLSRAAAAEAPALIVWPESALPASLPSDVAARAALAALAREVDAYLLVASSGRDKSKPEGAADRWANSAFLFSPAGEIVGRYDKVRLLPFNEYVPLRGRIPWPRWAAGEMQDAVAGAQRTVFRIGDARFAALICWENLFGGEFRASAAQGVDFMVSLSNEAFTEVGPGREQLYAMNALRAVENGVSVARAATTGVSALIAPDGRALARVADAQGRALDAVGYAVHELPLAGSATPYLRFGDWIVGVEGAILGAAFWAARRRAGAA
jgi:apolipoprotein N-acyltransferase